MRTTWTTILALGISAGTATARGQEMMKPEAGGEAAADAKKAAAAERVDVAALFRRLDADGDKVVKPSEVSSRARPIFDRLLAQADSNGDGSLDESEAKAIAEVVRPHQPALTPNALADTPKAPGEGQGPLAPARFQASDLNGDGKLSREEFTGPPARFTQVDTDKDGFITHEEATAARANGMARYRAMDKDKDGKLSIEEFTGQPAAFDLMDANSDGYLTLEEIGAFLNRNNPAAKKEAKKPDAK